MKIQDLSIQLDPTTHTERNTPTCPFIKIAIFDARVFFFRTLVCEFAREILFFQKKKNTGVTNLVCVCGVQVIKYGGVHVSFSSRIETPRNRTVVAPVECYPASRVEV